MRIVAIVLGCLALIVGLWFAARSEAPRAGIPEIEASSTRSGERGTGALSDAPRDVLQRVRELELLAEQQALRIAELTAELEELRRTPTAPVLLEKEPEAKDEVVLDAEGRVIAKGKLRDGKRSGPWQLFYPTGEPMGEGPFYEGKRMGLWKEWSLNGKYENRGRYVDDLKEGVWTYWEGGQYVTEFKYSAGEPLER